MDAPQTEAGPQGAVSPRAAARARVQAAAAAQVEVDVQGGALLAAGLAANRIEPWSYDPERRLLTVGPAAAAALGRGPSPASLTVEEVLQQVIPEDRAAVLGLLGADPRAPVRLRLRVAAPQGLLPIELRGEALPPTPGQPAGAMRGVFEDVSAWAALDEQRAQVSRRWAAAGGMRPGFLWEVDADGRLSWLSPRIAEVLGWAPEALRGQPLSALIADAGPRDDLLASARAGLPAGPVRARLRGPDGAQFDALLSAEAARDAATAGGGVVGAAVRVGGIGAALARLEGEQRAVLAEAQQKASFVASLSHEIRTPLSGLVGLADIVLDEALSPEQKAQLLTVRAQARHLLGVVDKVLELARIEAGRAQAEPEAASPAALLDGALRALAAAGASAVELRAGPTPAAWRARVDPGLLQQLLRHLIALGLGAAREAGGGLEVGLAPEPAGDALRLRLRGAGAAALGEALGQAHSSAAAIAAGGSSRQVDLSLCRHLLRALGASLHVDAEPGLIEVRAPAPRLPDAAPVAPLPPGPVALVLPPGPPAAHLEALLRAQGVEVLRFGAAGEALGGLARVGWAVSAVVVAVDLPPVGGITLLRALSAQPGLAGAALLAAPLGCPPALLSALGGLPRVGLLGEPWVEGDLAAALGLRPPAGPARGAGLRGVSALLVEDHPVNQEVLKALLGRLGVEVEVCGDGQAALSALSQRRYDVALMDCHLPVLDGLAVTRLLRARERQLQAPRQVIIALTASDLASDRLACREAGMDGYLLKPTSLPELAAHLEAALAARPLGAR